MTDRSTVIAAVTAELEQRAGECLEEHAAIAARVADRLGLRGGLEIGSDRSEAPGITPQRSGLEVDRDLKPENVLDVLGTGVFVRRLHDYPIEILARFGWAIVPVINAGRAELNRDPAWWADARAAGVRLVAMDWLPTPTRMVTGHAEAVAWSAEHGAIAWLIDAEAEWHHRPVPAAALVAEARQLCDAHGLGLGLTSLAMLPDRREWEILVAGCADLSVPQPYDRYGAYEADYAARSVDRWQRLGAQRIAVGRGAFVDPDGVGPEKARWRSPQEIERHRATTPPGLATAWWPPAGRPSARVVDAIVR